MEGRVIKSTGSWYNVQTSDSSIIACRLKGKFKLKGLKVTNPLAVGDAVNFEIEEQGENTGVITHILPRKNYIIRKSPHKTQHGHIIASNVDQAILISTLVFPKTSLGFIDRFLVSAESFRIKALVVFNKADIYTNDMVEAYSELATLYTNLGYETMLVSAEENEGLEEFKAILQGKTSLLSGHSGVGNQQS